MSKHTYQRLSHPPTGPHAVEDLGHAQNAAWWTVMVLGIIAGAVGTWAVVILSPAWGIAAVILTVVTIVAGVVMSKMGMGSYTYSEGDTATNSESLGIK
ncbi:hypothetical protein ASG73_02865 [Janibacter sp. Soil728]|uniref:hypothetical protein n=1 Tax=Janibacter sp. Soil728 TaxID=1736393 RepID=UPI0006FCA41E|nr:hypothetical protein [Janibacter sp. Soil728]KRE39291.1 hypothetical protein ASG73_02865 [Janibacter sp. Soil728]